MPQMYKMAGPAPLIQYGQTGSWLILRIAQSITDLKDSWAFFFSWQNHDLQNPIWQKKCSKKFFLKENYINTKKWIITWTTSKVLFRSKRSITLTLWGMWRKEHTWTLVPNRPKGEPGLYLLHVTWLRSIISQRLYCLVWIHGDSNTYLSVLSWELNEILEFISCKIELPLYLSFPEPPRRALPQRIIAVDEVLPFEHILYATY